MNTLPLPLTLKRSSLSRLLSHMRAWWRLLKSLQTGLLLVTAGAGYISGCCLNPVHASMFAMLASLFLAVGGSTILNMVYDRDIDALMQRTAARPLPNGAISADEALALGAVFSLMGVAWAFALNPLFGAIVLAGLFFDALVYTLWLKRRTPFSILIGGLSGGMPALAGRVLAVGHIDLIGVLLAFGVLLWIPTHIMTFNIKYAEDYHRAGIPTFPSTYGVRVTRWIIAFSTILAALTLFGVVERMSMPSPYWEIAAGLGAALVGLVLFSLLRPSQKLNFILYKGASIYMLGTMLMIILAGI
jgi:protoheme IX farnesyltransferase